jgi:hypothetical protein
MVREQDVSPMKRCRHCGKTKPREAFRTNRRHRDGLHFVVPALRGRVESPLARPEREVYNAGRRVDPYPPWTCATCGQEFTPVRVDQRYPDVLGKGAQFNVRPCGLRPR